MPIPGTALSTALISGEIETEFGNKRIAKKYRLNAGWRKRSTLKDFTIDLDDYLRPSLSKGN